MRVRLKGSNATPAALFTECIYRYLRSLVVSGGDYQPLIELRKRVLMRRERLDELPVQIVGHEPIIHVCQKPSAQALINADLNQRWTENGVDVEPISSPRRCRYAGNHRWFQNIQNGLETHGPDVMRLVYNDQSEVWQSIRAGNYALNCCEGNALPKAGLFSRNQPVGWHPSRQLCPK